MKRRLKLIKSITKSLLTFFMLSFVFMLSIVKVKADVGPKPTITITITNLKKSDYAAGIFIKSEFYGPHGTYENMGRDYYFFGTKEDLDALYNNIPKMDGWYLSDISYHYNDVSELVVPNCYYFPRDFRLAILDLKTNEYYVFDEIVATQFNSYYSFDFYNYNSLKLEDKTDYSFELEEEKSYKDVWGFFLRLFVTLLIEMGIAFLFKFNKKSMFIILGANIVTQIGLNLVLSISSFNHGKNALLIPYYIFLEILILLVEGIIYKIFCKRGKNESRRGCLAYATIANAASFFVGILLWFLV